MEIPRLSAKEAEILRLLVAGGEMYGLELVGASTQLKRGTVYVTLSRMKQKGYVDSRQVVCLEMGGPPKRLFRATGYGAQVFRAWQTAETAFRLEWAL